MDYSWILLGISIYCVSIIITAYGLKALFDAIKYTSFKEWIKLFLMSFSLGLVLPGRAGDLSIIYFTKEKSFDIGQSTALTIIDKLITLIIFGCIAAIGIFTLLSSEELYWGLLATGIAIIGGLSLFSSIGRTIIKRIIGKYAEKFKGFNKTFKDLLKYHKDKIAINIFITLLRPIGNALLMIFILKAMGVEVPFTYVVLINAITLIASLIPLTPSGIGIRESIGAFLFTKIGVALEISLSMYLIILMMNYATAIVGVSYYWLSKKTNNSLS